MHRRPLRLGLQLGLFQLALGFFSVLSLGSQQLMGFTRVWFGDRSDRIPLSRLRRTPFIVGSALALALLFALACQLVLQMGRSMAAAGDAPLILLLTLVFIAIGTAIAAGGTAFSALVADRPAAAVRLGGAGGARS